MFMYSQRMSRLRAPARGRLRGQNALSKRPGRFERAEARVLDERGCLEAESGSMAAGEAPAHGRFLSGNTPILMADGTTGTLAALKAGDAIYGTVLEAGQRRYVKTQVLACWSAIQPAWRVRLEDGTEIVAGGGHRFLTSQGWKLAGPGERSAARLQPGDELLGTGAFADQPAEDSGYRSGYLCGLLRGYASPQAHTHTRGRVRQAQRDPPPLMPCSGEAWQRAERYLRQWRPQVPRVPLARALGGCQPLPSFRAPLVRPLHEELQEALRWPDVASRSWSAGFLAGIFDAAGSFEDGVLSICHPDPAVMGHVGAALRLLKFERRLDLTGQRGPRRGAQRGPQPGRLPVPTVRIEGGLAVHLRFFHACAPAISARRDISGQPVSGGPRLAVVAIEYLGTSRRLHDITTGSGDFIANGVVSHNWEASTQDERLAKRVLGKRSGPRAAAPADGLGPAAARGSAPR